ncbi:MAG TPA: hypothetical protein P5274_00365 [Candidatus Paceibacterota bacterium]|nr:hypothetical protein [Candidatus Paceibacterota bacterium]
MNNLEIEIAQLQQEIETRKNLLEQQGGIIEEKELVSNALNEMFTGSGGVVASQTSRSQAQTQAGKTSDPDVSYLSNVDEETVRDVNALIQKLPTLGIAGIVKEAELGGAYLVDVLHDVLVDKMYEELTQRGLIK